MLRKPDMAAMGAVYYLIPGRGALAGRARLALLLGVVDGGLDCGLVGRLRGRQRQVRASRDELIIRAPMSRDRRGMGPGVKDKICYAATAKCFAATAQ